jgi:hypothetical protein
MTLLTLFWVSIGPRFSGDKVAQLGALALKRKGSPFCEVEAHRL